MIDFLSYRDAINRIITKVKQATKYSLIIAVMMVLWMVVGIALGAVIHLQFFIWAIFLGLAIGAATGIHNPYVAIAIAFDVIFIFGIGLAILFMLTKTDAQLAGRARYLIRRFPRLIPEEDSRMLLGLGFFLTLSVLSATVVIFGLATQTWEAEYGNVFAQPHSAFSTMLYIANIFLKGILYSTIDYFGFKLSQLQPATWKYQLFANSYQWLLSAVTAALLWRVFKYVFKHRDSLIIGHPRI